MPTVITPQFTCPAQPLVAVSDWATRLEAPVAAGAAMLAVPAVASAELRTAIGSNHTYVRVNDGVHTDDVHVWFDGTVLACDPLPRAFPAGACVSAEANALVMFCLLKQAIEAGTNGADGADGSAIHFITTSAPAGTLGVDGDVAFNATSGDIFQRTAGTWSLKGNMHGADGQDGDAGQDGEDGVGVTWHDGAGVPSALLGVDGDRYINTLNGDLYKKFAGAWTIIANIRGPSGVSGNNGTPGSRWFFGNSDPDDSFGSSIDLYLEIDQGVWYSKSTGTWVQMGTLRGVPGQDGADGQSGYSISVFATVYGAETSGWHTFPSPTQGFVLPSTSVERDTSEAQIDLTTQGVFGLGVGSFLLSVQQGIAVVHLDAPFNDTGTATPANVYVDVEVDAGSGFEVHTTLLGFSTFSPFNTQTFQTTLGGTAVVDAPAGAEVRFVARVEGLGAGTGAAQYRFTSIVLPVSIVRIG